MAIKQFITFVKDTYKTNEFIPLHQPTFNGHEKEYVLDTIDSTFVSSVGNYVNQFESQLEHFTGATKAVATINGTAALHVSLLLSGVKPDDLVITQALTFVATCNAIRYIGADPVLVDVSKETLGMCPIALEHYLQEFGAIDAEGNCYHKTTGQIFRAVVPMHTFGHPVVIDAIAEICERWNIVLVEDAAESLGSTYRGRHTGTFGAFSALSFNGNKIITTGSGGVVLCQSEANALRAKHLTTTAKAPHAYEYYHDEVGFNYRMSNLNAALGCAQLEQLDNFIDKKRLLAHHYRGFFNSTEFEFVVEPHGCRSNYWLNAIICPDKHARDQLLKMSSEQDVMVRPAWKLMHHLPMYQSALRGELKVSEWLETRLVNIPSTPVI
ncbi:aminotransferase DegT [Pseudoalteromonas sp. BMB]|uniref:LegC family aminotransferase n=1 Tax=Pseudoalteromonas sp. BMB TaxID=1874619 RepID=UPI00083E254A|nr:LegC family aminotransferase [Pseudoalteromonas sp. BMB]ODB35886.1 aminotransferase DegT [Pseudoalteromonas sp. BMB]